MNIHVDTDGKFPPEYTEGDKILAIVSFWMKFHPSVRRTMISLQEQKGDPFSPTDGVTEVILKCLEQIDFEKLRRELNHVDSAKQKE